MQARSSPLWRTFAGAYYCCCAMAVLRLLHAAAPGSHAATVQAVGGGAGGGQPQRPGRDDAAPLRFAGHDQSPPPARNKRWSTTFGGNTNSKNGSANNAVRDCTTDSDCLETPYTSCAIDSSDKKRRCLCADGKQPLNGDCLKKPRALRTSCESDVECLPNAECKNNATTTNPRLKICMCKDGFVEEKESCNYGDMLTTNHAVLLIGVFAAWMWKDNMPV